MSIFTVDSENHIEDYLSEEELSEMPFMEKMEYILRNKIVKGLEYVVRGGGFLVYKLSSSGILWRNYYYDGNCGMRRTLPSTSNGHVNIFGKIYEKRKESIFRLRLNTVDGSIEKVQSFLTSENSVDYYAFFDHIHQRNEEDFVLIPYREVSGAGDFLMTKLNFEDNTISCHKYYDATQNDITGDGNNILFGYVHDIFWKK